MKTKTKVLTLVEIAIVLCSLFLVATLPGIAAEQNDQNQEMQKVSASEVTTASEDDFVLGVYGNANEDDTIDMRDLTYVKLIFFGKKPETELADAKYDGKINPLDFIQIKLIIVGKEKELTVVQYIGYPPEITEKTVTVPIPIESIVVLHRYDVEALCAFGEQDRIVGVTEDAKEKGELKTLIEGKPVVGTHFNPDIEAILTLKPDIALTMSYRFFDFEEKLNAVGIPLVQIDTHMPKKYSREIRNLGWMLNNQERAEELINFEQQHMGIIKERVEDLKDEQKTRVYFVSFPEYYGVPTHTAGKVTSKQDDIEFCGGINIFSDIKGYVTVDPEAVIERNPQVIFAMTLISTLGYDITDTGPVEKARNIIMDYQGFNTIDAVKNGHVYCVSTDASSTHHCIWLSYMAKYFYPELFEDIDPVDIHREWMERFLGIEYKGVYAYPTYPVT